MDIYILISASTVALTLCLLFGFIYGFRNAPVIIATIVSTRAISPGHAFLMCAFAEFLGVLLFGSAIVGTISKKMFGPVFQETRPEVLMVLTVGVLATILWGLFCYWKALPTSDNHALFAGLSGASWAAWGPGHLINSTLLRVFLVLICTPILALLISVGVTWLMRFFGEWMTPRVITTVNQLHVLGALFVAAVDGSNGGQIVLSLAIVSMGLLRPEISNSGLVMIIPFWLKLIVAAVMSLGVLMEGRRVVKKLGMNFYHLEIPQGVGAQFTAAGMILSCIHAGFPASTSHIVTGSILGSGIAKNPRAVRWSLALEIVMSWVLTIPATLSLAFILFKLLNWLES